jgi:hypothetical protein
MMMLAKLATARQQIEKIAASPIMFHQCCCGVNAGERAAAQILQQNHGGFWAGRRAIGASSRGLCHKRRDTRERRNKPAAPVLTSRLGSGGEP